MTAYASYTPVSDVRWYLLITGNGSELVLPVMYAFFCPSIAIAFP
ncbi:hypothetical protein ASZ90_015632 [hydrocarbon metagenome]|uniref:Uncharacterized protein n=1 Tax=hydrocarbon metagenome TaxID=938273 RepID=A0A0W8F1B4_9ZZZZ